MDTMSLAEPTTERTNGKTPELLVEYEEAVEHQKTIDAALAAARFTGTTQDLVTGDYIVWASGAIVGWAKTPQEAAHRAQACISVQAAHPSEPVVNPYPC